MTGIISSNLFSGRNKSKVHPNSPSPNLPLNVENQRTKEPINVKKGTLADFLKEKIFEDFINLENYALCDNKIIKNECNDEDVTRQLYVIYDGNRYDILDMDSLNRIGDKNPASRQKIRKRFTVSIENTTIGLLEMGLPPTFPVRTLNWLDTPRAEGLSPLYRRFSLFTTGPLTQPNPMNLNFRYDTLYPIERNYPPERSYPFPLFRDTYRPISLHGYPFRWWTGFYRRDFFHHY